MDRSLYSGTFFNGLIMELGDLEAAVLGSVLRMNKASVREVVKDLEPSRGLAYSTISTTLDRLYKKRMLEREEEVGRGGSRYIYTIPVGESERKGRQGSRRSSPHRLWSERALDPKRLRG
jgi:predicted transcriptional regulator